MQRSLLLITDPIGGSTSVQFEILSSLVSGLRPRYDLTAFTPFCDRRRALSLADAGCPVVTPGTGGPDLDRLLWTRGNRNESMLWAESWTREALLGKNGSDAATYLSTHLPDYTVNLSMTVPADCDLWWVLGTPLDQTIRGMAGVNLIARMADISAGRIVTALDSRVLHRIRARSLRIVANSPYLQDLYRSRGFPVEGVVYTLKDLSDFRPPVRQPRRDYVLVYVGKELDDLDFRSMVRSGVRLVGFGSKVPAGTRMRKLTQSIKWLGRVSTRELIELYSNALFTLFPFTCEPMGLVPIESMACGTPVLTYGRQGPGSTVLDGKTGWLVSTPEEMRFKATQIWSRGDSGISPEPCVLRAADFTTRRMVSELVEWIEGRCSIEPFPRPRSEGAWEPGRALRMAAGRG